MVVIAQNPAIFRYSGATVERYFDYGQLATGFVRVRCTACGDDRRVACSCKVRGLCPSCAHAARAARARSSRRS